MVKVIKVGGGILSNSKKYANVLHYLWGTVAAGDSIVLVVSAIGRNPDPYSTDGLNGSIPSGLNIKERDRLKSIGETYAVLKVTADLRKMRIKCKSFSYRELGLIIADKIKFNPKELKNTLKDYDILVVPGYIGKNEDDEPTTLKREGSDFSAAIICRGLKLPCFYLFKDMPGIYDKDGVIHRELTYKEFILIVKNFISPISIEAIEYAEKYKKMIVCLNTEGLNIGIIR